MSTKKWIVTAIALFVSALHFYKGRIFHGQFHVFVNGHMIDILLPMVLFLLMGLFQNKYIRSVPFRAAAIFGFGCIVEVSQFFGRPFFGSTFDPLDFLAYAGGVSLGVLLDLVIFPRLVHNWNR